MCHILVGPSSPCTVPCHQPSKRDQTAFFRALYLSYMCRLCSPFSIALICTRSRRIPASASANQEPRKGDLVHLGIGDGAGVVEQRRPDLASLGFHQHHMHLHRFCGRSLEPLTPFPVLQQQRRRSRPAARPGLVQARPQVCSGHVLYFYKMPSPAPHAPAHTVWAPERDQIAFFGRREEDIRESGPQSGPNSGPGFHLQHL